MPWDWKKGAEPLKEKITYIEEPSLEIHITQEDDGIGNHEDDRVVFGLADDIKRTLCEQELDASSTLVQGNLPERRTRPEVESNQRHKDFQSVQNSSRTD